MSWSVLSDDLASEFKDRLVICIDSEGKLTPILFVDCPDATCFRMDVEDADYAIVAC